jgi:hypothetical protein
MSFRPLRVLPATLIALLSPLSYSQSFTGSLLQPTNSTFADSAAPGPANVAPEFTLASSASSTGPADNLDNLPDAPQTQSSATSSANNQPVNPPKQTKRILFVIPNFRSVTADEKLPPTTTGEKFKITFEDSFDYSAFLEVAILAGMGEAQTSIPEFHGGWPGYGRYYWHSFTDNVDGNLWVEFLLPVATREDPRYYTLGHGGFVHRTEYAVSRLFITRNNEGNPTPNFSEVVGNGVAAGLSNLYYPSQERSWTKTGQRWVTQLSIDGLDDLVKEFWPEVNAKLFHDKY